MCNIIIAPNQNQGRSVRVNRKRRSRGRKNPENSVGKYASDAWSLAKRTAYGLNEIRKLINIETKVFDKSGTLGVNTTGTIVPISNMIQGVDYNQRIGNSLKLQRIEVNFRNLIGTGTNSFLRVMLVRDLDNQGATPNISDILQTVDVMSPRNYLRTERFSVLYDEFSNLNSVSQTGEVAELDLPHEGHIKYLDATSNPSSYGKGNLFLVHISNENVANQLTCIYYSRIYYTDD